MEMMIRLRSIENVKNFSQLMQTIDVDVIATSGKYVVDAKSIMALFSLNLNNPICLHINKQLDKNTLEQLEKYRIK